MCMSLLYKRISIISKTPNPKILFPSHHLIPPLNNKSCCSSSFISTFNRRMRWTPPSGAVAPSFHLPMRSYKVKNRTSTYDIKALRLITAIKTPYLPDGRFDLEAYDSLVNMQIEDRADGVIVGGTTGEGQLMSWDEHIMLIGLGDTINCFGTAIKVIGNTGSNSTREAVHATEQGFAVGMHAALHINPYYGKTSLEGMVAEDAVSISREDLHRLSKKTEDLHPPGLIKAIKMPSLPSGRFDLKAYDSSDNGAGMLMVGGQLLGTPSAVKSATICRESIVKQVPSVIMKAGGIAPRWHPATIVYVPDTLDPISCLNVKLEPPLGGSACYLDPIRRLNVKPEPPLGVSAFDLDSAYLNEIRLEPLLGGSACYPVSIRLEPLLNVKPEPSLGVSAFDLDSAYYLNEPLLGGCYPVSIRLDPLLNVKPEPSLGVSAFDLDSAFYFKEIRPEPPYGVLDVYLECRGTCYEDPICGTISFTCDTLIPSWCHDITRVVVLPRAAQILWRPKSKFKIRTLYGVYFCW